MQMIRPELVAVSDRNSRQRRRRYGKVSDILYMKIDQNIEIDHMDVRQAMCERR